MRDFAPRRRRLLGGLANVLASVTLAGCSDGSDSTGESSPNGDDAGEADNSDSDDGPNSEPGGETETDLESGATRAVDQGSEPRSVDESDCP